MIDNFTSIIDERNTMIERNLSLIKTLNAEIDEMKDREEVFERENDEIKAKFEKTQKTLIETREELQQFEKQENLEIEELETKQKIAIGLVNKLKHDIKNLEIKSLENEEQDKQEIVDMRKEISEYKDMFSTVTVENLASKVTIKDLEMKIAKFNRGNGFGNVEINADKETLVTTDRREELSIHKEIQMSHYKVSL